MQLHLCGTHSMPQGSFHIWRPFIPLPLGKTQFLPWINSDLCQEYCCARVCWLMKVYQSQERGYDLVRAATTKPAPSGAWSALLLAPYLLHSIHPCPVASPPYLPSTTCAALPAPEGILGPSSYKSQLLSTYGNSQTTQSCSVAFVLATRCIMPAKHTLIGIICL